MAKTKNENTSMYCVSPNWVEVSECDNCSLEKVQAQMRKLYNFLVDYYTKKIASIEQSEEYKKTPKNKRKFFFEDYTEKRRYIQSSKMVVRNNNELKQFINENGEDALFEKILNECKSNRIIEEKVGKKIKRLILYYKDIKPFTEYGVNDIVKYYYNKIDDNNKLLNSTITGNIATDLYRAIEKYISGEGKFIRKKKRCDYMSIQCSYKSKNLIGMELSPISIKRKQTNKDGNIDVYYTNTLTLKINEANNLYANFNLKWRGTEYDTHALEKLNDLKSGECRKITLKPEKIRGKIKYKVIFTLKGTPFGKYRELGKGDVGIDPGTDNITVSSKNGVSTTVTNTPEDDNTRKMIKRYKTLQRLMSRSLIANNPENYNEDGTIKKKKDCKPWKCSKNYFKYKDECKEIQRKLAAKRTIFQHETTNKLISMGDNFKEEDTSYKSMATRAKETTINEKTGKYNSKKRHGKTINNNAPSSLLNMLKNKVEQLGGSYNKSENIVACSQFDFTDEETPFKKHYLNERIIINKRGDVIPRDMLAAFNLQHCNNELVKEDLEKIKENNSNIDKKIKEIKENNRT